MTLMHMALRWAHISMGLVGILSGAAALTFRKGSRAHEMVGHVFFVSMLIMASMGATLAMTYSPNRGNVMGGGLTFYMVATAWATVRRKPGEIGRLEIALALLQSREERVDALERPRARPAFHARGGDEILAHGERGEDLPHLGNEADARLGDPVGRPAVDGVAVELHAALVRAEHAEEASHRGGLAHAVATDQRDALAARRCEAHAEEHLARSVARGETGHLEQGGHAGTSWSPRYAARTSAFSRIDAGSPHAITRPYTSTEMRSASFHTASMSCSTSRMP